MTASRAYIGRFAPSPTGALHFGSLLAALASYLDARHAGGQWLVRMEDLDPDREQPGAADGILRTLETLGLYWDGPVLYQSDRQSAYIQAIEELNARELVYRCECPRRRVRSLGGIYDGRCRQRTIAADQACALRIRVNQQLVGFHDAIQGAIGQNLQDDCGDFIIRRKDGLIAYQLAVVVDDAYQGITHVQRGADLLDSTPRQIHLQQCLGLPTPEYAHIPVASNARGQKLSKQHFARPLDREHAGEQLIRALTLLGQNPPDELANEPPETILKWAVNRWDARRLPRTPRIPAPLE